MRLLLMLLLLPGAMALEIDSGTQVILGEGDRQNLADDFSGHVVTTADANANGPLLIIGGPCANEVWEKYTGMTCESWPYPEGTGAVLSFEYGRVMLIGGTTQEDAELLVSQLLDLDRQDRQFVSDTLGADEFIITEGERSTLRTGAGRVVVSDLRIGSGRIERITINTDDFANLAQGRSVVADDLLVEIIEVSADSATIRITEFDDRNDDEITLQEGDEDSVTINGNRIDIEDLEIDEDTLDVTIDGEEFNNLEEGDERTIDDATFSVEEIDDDQATFSFEERDELEEGDEFTVQDGDDLSVDIEGETLDFDDVSIANAVLSAVVEGTAYTNLMVNSMITESGVTVRLTEIDEEEATFTVESTN